MFVKTGKKFNRDIYSYSCFTLSLKGTVYVISSEPPLVELTFQNSTRFKIDRR